MAEESIMGQEEIHTSSWIQHAVYVCVHGKQLIWQLPRFSFSFLQGIVTIQSCFFNQCYTTDELCLVQICCLLFPIFLINCT
jgi:hypothetical protein